MQGGDLLHRDLITEDLSSFFLTSLSAFNSTLTTPSSLAHLYLTQQQQLASPSAHATPPPQPLQHTVVGGDTWAGLAVRYGVSIADIKRANGQFSDLLLPGTQLGIPLQQPPHFPATEATMHMAFSPTTTTQITDAAAMFEYGSPPGSAPYGYTQASHEQYYFYLQQQQQLQDPFTSSSSFLPSSTSTFRQAEASAAMASALYPIDSITTPSSPPSQAAAFDPFHLHCSPSPPRSSPQRSPAACASPSSARRQVSASPLYAAHDHSTTSTTTTTSNNKNRGSSSIRAKQPMQPPASLKTAPAGKSGQRSSAAARQHARASKEYSAVDIASFHRHAVSHEDTLQGIALRYGVAPADVKRLNRMATDEVYAYSEVIVPIDRELAARLPPPKAIDPDRAHRFQLAAFRKRTATDETEANYYIKLAEGDFKEALRLWHSDQQWEDEHRGPDDPLPQSLRNSPLVSIPSPSFAPRLSRHC